MTGFKLFAASFVALAGVSVICPLCATGPSPAVAQQSMMQQAPTPDTATVRLHISGMTCGSCPITARFALQHISGVMTARVTLQDSLGVVRYHPHQVSPSAIAADLLRMTGYRATVLAAPVRRGSKS